MTKLWLQVWPLRCFCLCAFHMCVCERGGRRLVDHIFCPLSPEYCSSRNFLIELHGKRNDVDHEGALYFLCRFCPRSKPCIIVHVVIVWLLVNSEEFPQWQTLVFICCPCVWPYQNVLMNFSALMFSSSILVVRKKYFYLTTCPGFIIYLCTYNHYYILTGVFDAVYMV